MFCCGCLGVAIGTSLTEEDTPEPLLEEAIDWLLLFESEPENAELERRIAIWLSRSDAHMEAWKKARRVWNLMGYVSPAHEELWKKPLQLASVKLSAENSATVRKSSRIQNRRRARTIVGAAIAAVMGLFAFFAIQPMMSGYEADYQTIAGESQIVLLEDGSKVFLGGYSAIAQDFSGPDRKVKLLAGEAFFEVARDTERPFVVEAGGVDVTVLGTVFNLRLSSHTATVELAEGAVGVTHELMPDSKMEVLAPMDMVVVDRSTGAVTRSTIASEDIGAWRNGKLFVQDETISAVIEQIQRYQTAWISVPDSTLANQRVTGFYDLNDPDRALRALVQPYGGNVREISSYMRLVTRF